VLGIADDGVLINHPTNQIWESFYPQFF